MGNFGNLDLFFFKLDCIYCIVCIKMTQITTLFSCLVTFLSVNSARDHNKKIKKKLKKNRKLVLMTNTHFSSFDSVVF